MALKPCVPAAHVIGDAADVTVKADGADQTLAREIWMRVVDAGVDDGRRRSRSSRREIPGGRRMNVGARDAGKAVDRLADVVEAPQLIEAWIVGLLDRVDDEVRLGVDDVRAAFQPLEERVGAEGSRLQAKCATMAQRTHRLGVDVRRE